MAELRKSDLFSDITGILPENACVVIVKTEWNKDIVDELEAGSKRVLDQYNIRSQKTLVVPGAFEVPFAVKKYWELHKDSPNKPDAFIAFACVIRGDTPHFEYVCQGITGGISQLNVTLPVPVIFGVLTVNDKLQALERIGGHHGHKGEEAAITALKMIAQFS